MKKDKRERKYNLENKTIYKQAYGRYGRNSKGSSELTSEKTEHQKITRNLIEGSMRCKHNPSSIKSDDS